MRRVFAAAALAVVAMGAHDARADTEACARAYEQAQILRKDAKLVESRSELLVCAQDSCPAVLRKDCVMWLGQLEDAIPKVAISVHGPDGCDRPDAHVWIDDVEAARGAKGLAIEVDPGTHSIRASVDDLSTSRSVVVASGDKQRVVTLTFAAENVVCGAAAPASSSAPALAPAPPPPRPEAPRRQPAIVYVLGGIGLTSALVGAGFGVSAWSQKGTLDDCKGSCALHDVDTMRRTFFVADLVGGLAIITLAAAVTLYSVGR